MPKMQVLSHCKAGPQYTMRGRQPVAQKVMTPGPGAYSSESLSVKYPSSPGANFGTGSPRDALRPTSAPGPGQYSPVEKHKPNSAAVSFGTAQRKSTSPRLETPGPGTYVMSPRLGTDGPKFTASPRRDALSQPQSPGPGAYEPQHPLSIKVGKDGVAFARSARTNGRHVDAPGPGQYNPEKPIQRTSEYSFGHTGRKEMAPKSEPGPGSYNHNSLMGTEGPKYSAASKSPRTSQRSAMLTPGPGAYSGDIVVQKYSAAPKFGFGNSSRDNLRAPSSPGPGQYHTQSTDNLKPMSPRAKFGTAQRSTSQGARSLNTPGPGAYTMTPRMGREGPSFSAGKRGAMRTEMTPGPGAYNGHTASTYGSGTAIGFGTSRRTSQRENMSPGPGSYEQKKVLKDGPSHSFGNRPKEVVDTTSRTPGPGAHDHFSSF
eukprot:TRINITY_DN12653_c0_g2_i1.p1 TRINITY_DN12653_c0_g2~~TRINITY_DN12653_c0_g2_i1.p1  ORF type:complete len:429 (-),score=48.29 TRINITY_DN12653_c0_g2_i1:81-1367(-)